MSLADTVTLASPIPSTREVVAKPTRPISARKRRIAIQSKIAALKAEVTVLEEEFIALQAAADAEPEEFDGATVVIGANVVVVIGNGDNRTEVDAIVIAKRNKAEGEKGPDLMFKVQIGSGFDTETKVVYPGQILRYAAIKTA